MELLPAPFRLLDRASRRLAHWLIRGYQLSLSMLVGRWCRHLPTCSEYTDEAIQRHGFWPGGWIGLSRLCRCNPLGTDGFDPVPKELPKRARWYTPWRYGRWRSVERPSFTCEPLDPDQRR
jgi:uncharacterized protein